MSCPYPSGRLARWSLCHQDFDFCVIHKPGECDKVPDALSHNLLQRTDSPIDLLPDYALIGDVDIRTLPPVMQADRLHIWQLQLEDAEIFL